MSRIVDGYGCQENPLRGLEINVRLFIAAVALPVPGSRSYAANAPAQNIRIDGKDTRIALEPCLHIKHD